MYTYVKFIGVGKQDPGDMELEAEGDSHRVGTPLEVGNPLVEDMLLAVGILLAVGMLLAVDNQPFLHYKVVEELEQRFASDKLVVGQ